MRREKKLSNFFFNHIYHIVVLGMCHKTWKGFVTIASIQRNSHAVDHAIMK